MAKFQKKKPEGVPVPSETPAPATAKPAEQAPPKPAEPPEQTEIPETQEFVRRDASGGKGLAPRITFNLTDDGKIDLGRTTDETKARIKTAFSGHEELFGLVPPGPRPQLVSVGMCAHLYGLLGEVEGQLAQRVWGLTPTEADRIFTFGPDDVNVLAEPTADVLNKYVSVASLKYKEELSLALALLYVHQRKIYLVRMLMTTKNKLGSLGPVNAPPPPIRPRPNGESKAAEVMRDFIPPVEGQE